MKKLGVDYASMNLIADAIEHHSEAALKEGDVVEIDAEGIMGKPNFATLQPEYQEFIKMSVGQKFTVVKEESTLEQGGQRRLRQCTCWGMPFS